jgi:electron transfer flavoprotein beta subunit
MVKIVSAVKHVPVEDTPRVSKKTGKPIVDLEEGRMNRLGRKALGVGLELAQQDPNSEVIAVSLGPKQAESTLREALAMGADRGVLVADPLLEDSSGLSTAKALASTVREIGDVDIVLAGARTTDRFAGTVGPAMAALMGYSIATHGQHAHLDDEHLVFEKRRLDDSSATLRVPMPCLLSFGQRTPLPQHATAWGVHAAYESDEIQRLELDELDLSADEVGPGAATTPRANVEPVPEKERDTEVFENEPDQVAESLHRRLTSRGLLR